MRTAYVAPLVAALAALTAAAPRAGDPPDRDAAGRQLVAQARAALRSGDYAQAIDLLRDARRGTPPDGELGGECRALLALTEAIGEDRLAAAVQAIEERRYGEAADALLSVRRTFRGLAVARRAAAALDALRAQSQAARDTFARRAAEATAEQLLAEVIDCVRDRLFGPAYEQAQRILAEYADTPAAAQAQAVLDRMNQNTAMMREVRLYLEADTFARLMALKAAENDLLAGRQEQARAVFLRVLQELVAVSQEVEQLDPADAKSVLDFTVRDGQNRSIGLSKYRGRVLLIVNVASECGYTPQYAQLQKLHETYADRGLRVLAFPANNFGLQEPGTNEQIQAFCQDRYGVTFDVFDKVSVLGAGMSPLYAYLTSRHANPACAGDIRWNFTKFLVGRDGQVAARFEPAVKPDAPEVVEVIERLLAAPAEP